MPHRGPIGELLADVLHRVVLLGGARSTKRALVGWDWASETHDVTVMEETGARADRSELAHTGEGVTKHLARLRRHGDSWTAAIYDQASAIGKRHPSAVRILARTWLRVIRVAC